MMVFYFCRAITKTVVSSELRAEIEENQKVMCLKSNTVPLPLGLYVAQGDDPVFSHTAL